MKLFPDALPDAITLELPEDIVNRRARRKQAARQIPPRTARAQEVENRVHRRAHVGLARPPAGFRRRNQRLQTLPLRITQIAGKGRSRLLVGRPMRLRPHPKSKPPSHLGGGKSRAANPRYKLLGQALSPQGPRWARWARRYRRAALLRGKPHRRLMPAAPTRFADNEIRSQDRIFS